MTRAAENRADAGLKSPRAQYGVARFALVASLLSWSGCIKPNADYDLIKRTQPTSAQDLDGSSETGENESELSPTSGQSTTAQEPKNTSTTDTTQSSTPSQNPTNSTSTSGDTTSTASAPPTPIDIDFDDGTWRELEISLSSSATKPAKVGYSMQLYFDHSSFVRSGADANGHDLAVVFHENGRGYAIDRFLDPGYLWNHTATRIWFPLQQPVSPGQTVGGTYYLVTGSSQFPALSSPDRVFLLHDDFQGSQIDPNKWAIESQGVGNASETLESFGARLSAASSSADLESKSLRSLWSGSIEGILAELRLRFPNAVNEACNQLMPMAFETSSDNRVQHGLSLRAGDWLHTYSLPNQPVPQYWLVSGITHNANWNRYSIGWNGLNQRAWLNTIEQLNRASETRPDEQTLHLRVQTGAGIGNCSGTRASVMDIDWIWLRRFTLPEPQTVLK